MHMVIYAGRVIHGGKLSLILQMYQIQLKFKGQNKKITVAKSLQSNELQRLIAQCFSINERVVGVTNNSGCFLELAEFNKIIPTSPKQTFALVTAKDVNQDSMSFASEYYQRQPKVEQQTQPSIALPSAFPSRCLGSISDLELFEEFCLVEEGVTVVACCTKDRPSEASYDYYLYPNDTKNSLIVYSGNGKVCEFYVPDWRHQNPQINLFIQGMTGEQPLNESRRSGEFKKREKVGEGQLVQQEQGEQGEQERPDEEIKQELVQKFSRLLEEGELSQLQFYKLKSQLLENPQDFVRKYQMGTRQRLGTESRGASKEQRRERGRSGNRAKRYQIPIIVRKYNNVVEKISTSYPLTLEQERAINLILQIQLKGLISEKEAGKFKSLVLQQDTETFKLFREYFEDKVDQIQLAGRLRRKKGSAGEQGKQRVEHNMRLLIKYAKQNSYELLRKLVLEENKHVLTALEGYRSNKNVELLVSKLEKVANYYRAKELLEDVDSS